MGSLQRSQGLLAGFKEPTSKGRKGVRYGRVEGREWEGRKRKGPQLAQESVHTQCPKSWKIPWLQNLSDWWGRQHRRLPRAANILAPPLPAGQNNVIKQNETRKCGATLFGSHQRHLFPPGLVTFGWVRFPCATPWKHNAEFTKGGWELRFYFKPFVG